MSEVQKVFKVKWWIEAAYGDPEGVEDIEASSKDEALQMVFARVKDHFPHIALSGKLKMEFVASPEPDPRDSEIQVLRQALAPFAAQWTEWQRFALNGGELHFTQWLDQEQFKATVDAYRGASEAFNQ